MGKPSQVIIHTNPKLKHQVQWAEFLRAGIEACGDVPIVTNSRTMEGDIHIVQGPHYAKRQWQGHPRVVLLDRCFYGDAFEHVSLTWMDASGAKMLPEAAPEDRPKPKTKAWKTQHEAALVLADYGQDISAQISQARKIFDRVYARHHPADRRPPPALNLQGHLKTALSIVDVVIGHATTALIAAVIEGRPSICTSPENAAWEVTSHEFDAPLFLGDRGAWLNRLSYAQWHMSETAQAWEYLNGMGRPVTA